MKKTLLRNLRIGVLAGALALLSGSVMASPAYPGKVRIKQPDGTFIEVYVRGDELFNYYENAVDGLIMQRGADGFIRNVADSKQFLASLPDIRAERKQTARGAGAQRIPGAPGPIAPVFPTTGEVRGLFILVEYPDCRFSEAAKREIYEDVLNSDNYTGNLASASIKNYFQTQSGGKFTPVFDVVGPFMMDHPRAYYGYSETGLEPVWGMFEEGCRQADAQGLDFSKYDSDGDGVVDFIFVLYAGYGQAQGGPEESVWPQAVDLTYKVYDEFDGLYLGQGACSCELHGNSGEQLDGMGTVCHEFSHVLGLPDLYDVYYSGHDGMMHWDVMDVGSYNNDSRTPPGYSAMEKYNVGWITPTVLGENDEDVTLNPANTSSEACFVVSDVDENEYYVLENRQLQGWDASLPGHGLFVTHVKYDMTYWKMNMINTDKNGFDHVALVPADNKYSIANEEGDTYPGTSGNTELSTTSIPAVKWHKAGGRGFSITDIAETDGKVSFKYKSGLASGITMPFIDAELNGGNLLVGNPEGKKVEVYGIDGTLVASTTDANLKASLGKGMYIIKQGNRSVKICVK